jgi:hypothetical protein
MVGFGSRRGPSQASPAVRQWSRQSRRDARAAVTEQSPPVGAAILWKRKGRHSSPSPALGPETGRRRDFGSRRIENGSSRWHPQEKACRPELMPLFAARQHRLSPGHARTHVPSTGRFTFKATRHPRAMTPMGGTTSFRYWVQLALATIRTIVHARLLRRIGDHTRRGQRVDAHWEVEKAKGGSLDCFFRRFTICLSQNGQGFGAQACCLIAPDLGLTAVVDTIICTRQDAAVSVDPIDDIAYSPCIIEGKA